MSSIEIARRYVDAWNARDTARLAATFREGGTYQDPNTGGPLGTQALAAYAAGMFAAFPDLEFEAVSWRESGPGEVVFAWRMKGTNQASFKGLPPTGARIAVPGVDLITVRDDGVERVEGFFDRATVLEQLGVQVVVQPYSVGPVRFGVSSQVRSGSAALPGALALTMIEARSDAEVQEIRGISRRIMLQLQTMPGFLSFQGAVVGRRLTTVTLWETPEAVRQVIREANHKKASADLFGGSIAGAFHSSTWVLQSLGELWLRCPECGALRDSRTSLQCECGAAPGERPPYW